MHQVVRNDLDECIYAIIFQFVLYYVVFSEINPPSINPPSTDDTDSEDGRMPISPPK